MAGIETQSDLALVACAQKLDEMARPALEVLLERYEPLVRSTVRKLRLKSCDRDDALQGGRLGLIEAVRRFDMTRAVALAPYARYLIRREALSAVFGTRRRHPASPVDSEVLHEQAERQFTVIGSTAAVDVAEHIVAEEECRCAGEFLDQLSGADAELAGKVFADGTSQADIARSLGVTRAAVNQRVRRLVIAGAEHMAINGHMDRCLAA